MNKAIKYRAYPTDEQKQLFSNTFGCCRKVFNLMLGDKIAYYKETKKNLITTPACYKEEYPYLKDVDSLALCNVQLNLQKAYTNFFKNPKHFGFPVFKSKKKAKRSYTTNNLKDSIYIEDGRIRLPKAGMVKIKIHRQPGEDWVIKSATVSQASDGSYYISVLFEFEKEIQPVENPQKALGLDYKSDGLYMDSEGNVAMPHHSFQCFRKNQKKLAKAQRVLSRKIGNKKNETKSNNYWKQYKKVNRIHQHIANQRKDKLHKLSTEIANQYDIVCVESLDMQAISNKGFGNGKATMDNGYGMFLDMLRYKLKERGKYLVSVDKWFASSQICSQCGQIHKMPLEERVYRCDCGLVIDRDLNAAINIKNEGLRMLLA